MHGSTLADRINTKVIFNETNILTVNQLNAQAKLVEVWKSQNDGSYPLKWINRCDDIKRTGLKSSNKPELVINGHSHTQSNSFINDAARIWNEAPLTIKESSTLSTWRKNKYNYLLKHYPFEII